MGQAMVRRGTHLHHCLRFEPHGDPSGWRTEQRCLRHLCCLIVLACLPQRSHCMSRRMVAQEGSECEQHPAPHPVEALHSNPQSVCNMKSRQANAHRVLTLTQLAVAQAGVRAAAALRHTCAGCAYTCKGQKSTRRSSPEGPS